MSHTLGVKCQVCKAVLIPMTPCPERACPGNHGYTYQPPGQWAAANWPDHPCFQERSATR